MLLVEQVARQAVHLAHVAGARERLGVQVVRREVIAARHDEPVEIALLARHAVQRLDRAHHREIRNELVVGVDEQLRPRPLDRHRFDQLAVAREPPVLDDAARLEQRRRASRYAQRSSGTGRSSSSARTPSVGAGDRDALRVAGELELRLRRLERRELDVAVGEDEHAPALDAPVHAPRHLQDLVRAEVQPA